MSALIKSKMLGSDGEPVRPLTVAAGGAPDTLTKEALLETRIAELEVAIAERERVHSREIEEARAEGARKALEARSEHEAKSLQALQQALDKARSDWGDRLTGWETAAVAIARAVLEQVFTGSASRSELVESAVCRRLDQLEASTIIRIRVSPEDFPDEEALAGAARAIGGAVELISDTALVAGGCVVDLKLGHIDLGLGAQWQRVSDLLDRLEREGRSE